MSTVQSSRLGELIRVLELKTIVPMEIASKRLGDAAPQGAEIQLQWNQALADGDPVTTGPDTKAFRPKYDLAVTHGESLFFQQTSIFILAFKVKDNNAFDQLWADEDVRAVFVERQIRRTIWPIFRQHVLDGMSRLSLPPVILPWIA